MRDSWRRFFRRVAATCMATGATAWGSAASYAQLAFDNATDPVYADGWQAGDNGGYGFLPWNFDNDTLFHVEGRHEIDGPPNQSPYNQLGTAWRLGLNYLDEGNDIARAGRGLAAPLQIDQTVTIVVDNPREQRFFGGYFIRLNTGGGNICYDNSPCTPGTSPQARFGVTVFNYTTPSDWGRWAATSIGYTSLFAADDEPTIGNVGTNEGLRIEFTLTGSETFDLTLTPLDNPAAAFTGSGTLDNPGGGPIDWIEFTHFMTETSLISPNEFDTDFFIGELQITEESLPVLVGDYNQNGVVDTADYTKWRDNVGAATLPNRDPDHTGPIGPADYEEWSMNFGSANAAGTMAAVPEPGFIVFVLAGITVLACAAIHRGWPVGEGS